MTWQVLPLAAIVACATFVSALGAYDLRRSAIEMRAEIENRAITLLAMALLLWLGAILLAPYALDGVR